MIPFGSAGGCQNKVIEEAVTFAMVIFCGGVLPGQEYKTLKKRLKESKRLLNIYSTPACAVVKLM